MNSSSHLNQGDMKGSEIGLDLEIKKRKELFGNIISNQLISETIAEYLNLSDLKALSEVSKSCLQMVRDTKKFGEKAMLSISNESISIGPYPFVFDSTYPWKIIQIDLSLPIKDIEDFLPRIVHSAHTLQLKLVETYGLDCEDVNIFLKTIFTNSPNLKHLDLEAEFFDEDILNLNAFLDPQVQETICRLKSLRLYHYNLNLRFPDFDPARNFQQLFTIPGMQLERLKMPTSSKQATLPNIIATNASTLKDLQFTIPSCGRMKAISCPVLKSLNVAAEVEPEVEMLITFLTNQPLLEELNISVKGNFSFGLLSVIRGRCSKLRKLHIRAKYFGDVAGNNADWSFLAGMECLEDFRIFRPFSDSSLQAMTEYGTGAVFLSLLLAQKMKKIELRGLYRFWHQRATGQVEGGMIKEPQRIEMLNRFKNVTELKLNRSGNSISYKTMQTIIKEFRQLNVFEVSHCDHLTDYGITGMNPPYGREAGVSLKDLTGLTHLVIRACKLITTEGLLEAVSLPYLKSFVYLSRNIVSKEFVIKIAEQNPSLECFSVPLGSQSVNQINKEVKAVNCRLRDFSNYVHSRSWKNWEYDDSDSDADPISDSELISD